MRVPRALGPLTALKELYLSQNRLEAIGVSDFVTLTSVYLLHLHNNPLTRVNVTAFRAMPLLFNGFNETNTTGVRLTRVTSLPIATAGNTGVVQVGRRHVTVPPFTINPAPQQCEWVGPGPAAVQCVECSFGFTFIDATNTAAGCENPGFGPWATWTGNTTRNGTRTERWSACQNGTAETRACYEDSLPTELEVGTSVSIAAPLLSPVKNRFNGYANANFKVWNPRQAIPRVPR